MFKIAFCMSIILALSTGCASHQQEKPPPKRYDSKWSDSVRGSVLHCHVKFKEEYFKCLIANGAMI